VPPQKNTQFGYSRKDVIIIGVGLIGGGYVLYYGLQATGKAADLLGQLAIGQGAHIVDQGGFGRAPGVAGDQVLGKVEIGAGCVHAACHVLSPRGVCHGDQILGSGNG
jgi:hypothetical protein